MRDVPVRGEAPLADRAGREATRKFGVADTERVIQDGAAVHDPGALREELPEVLRQGRLARPGRSEEEDMGPRNERGDQIVVRVRWKDGPGEEGLDRGILGESLAPELGQLPEDLLAEPLGGALDTDPVRPQLSGRGALTDRGRGPGTGYRRIGHGPATPARPYVVCSLAGPEPAPELGRLAERRQH